MEVLKEYVIISLAASVIMTALGSTVSDPFKSSIKFISGLIMILILAVPLISAVNEFAGELSGIGKPPEIEESKENSDITAGIVREFKSRLENSAAQTAADLYGIERENVSADAVVNDSDITNIVIEKIKLNISGSVNNDRVKTELENIYHCEFEIAASERKYEK